MTGRIRRALLLLAAGVVGCEQATPNTTTFGHISDRVVRLAGGDSVQWQLTLPATVAGEPPGVLVEFYPYQPLGDTAALRARAVEFFRVARPELEPDRPAFIVLRAVDKPASERTGVYRTRNFGFVFEPRSDKRWYLLHESTPVED